MLSFLSPDNFSSASQITASSLNTTCDFRFPKINTYVFFFHRIPHIHMWGLPNAPDTWLHPGLNGSAAIVEGELYVSFSSY